jgi:hypothetical protein
MRRLIMTSTVALTLAATTVAVADGKIDKSSCTYKGHKLYGKIRAVTIGEDITVRVVTIAEDLRVEKVTIAPDSCGKWEMVDIGEDTKVRFVDIGEDIKIQYVTIAPGAS